MAEYISREAVIDMLHRHSMMSNSISEIARIAGIKRAVQEIPTADVVEVRHSYWYLVEYEYFTCADCGHDVKSGAESTREAKEMLKSGLYDNYCPNCGAKMDGKRKDGAGK